MGPFGVELFSLAHSIPEMSALAIRTPLGTIFHTGDWKLDATPTIGGPADAARLQKLGDEGVLALMIDSTNAFREGISPSEADVARSLRDIIKKAPRRVAVTTFSSNVARVKGVAVAAHEKVDVLLSDLRAGERHNVGRGLANAGNRVV